MLIDIKHDVPLTATLNKADRIQELSRHQKIKDVARACAA